MSALPIPLLDLPAQHRAVREAVDAAVRRVLASQCFILGSEGEALEREVAAYSGCLHGVGLSSGTDALLCALMALKIAPGDEVVTTPFTFVATAMPIARLGARAVFADIDADTYCLDASRIEAAIGPRTRCILPVHLFGQMADMVGIGAIARRLDIPVVEDAAQAIGSSRDGRYIGTSGLAATLSFFPSKNLGGAGDGGMLLTNDSNLADGVRVMRNHGQSPKHFAVLVGGNFRLDELQAAILRAKLPHLDAWTDARRRNAHLYREAFESHRLDRDQLEIPHEAPGSRHVYNQYVIRTGRRDALKAFLAEAGIASQAYYPRPLHLQACFSHWQGRTGQFPKAEEAARQALALPIHPELRPDEIARVADTIAKFLKA